MVVGCWAADSELEAPTTVWRKMRQPPSLVQGIPWLTLIQLAVRFALENQRLLRLQETDKLLGCEDGAEFDVGVFFGYREALPGFQGELLPDFFRDDDVEFRGQKWWFSRAV